MSFNDALNQGKYLLRLLIPTKAAGPVIGKGGENINGLSKKYDASMSVPDRNTPERVLTIVCSQESIVELFKEVIHILLQDSKSKPETRMVVHQSHVGQIMGRGGANVKELGEKTKTQIKICKEVCPMSTDRIVIINGQVENIIEAVDLLIKDLIAIPVKSVEHPYDPANYDPEGAYVYGGFTAGGGGNMRRGAPGHYDGFGGGPGWQERGPPPRRSLPNAGGYQGDGGFARPPAPANRVFPEDYLRGAEAVQMAIPKELCGKIFGNNGELVNALMKECGSRIDVGITISGNQQQIEMTQAMLKQSIRKPEPPAAYYVDDSLMSKRVPDEAGLVSRQPDPAHYMYDAQPEGTDFMNKYKL
uniref:K Homology domain-containing protein n=1 Tax=Ditylenchus dipsaci TaxID=166011 RepID=A0A915CKZ0_9BILA